MAGCRMANAGKSGRLRTLEEATVLSTWGPQPGREAGGSGICFGGGIHGA